MPRASSRHQRPLQMKRIRPVNDQVPSLDELKVDMNVLEKLWVALKELCEFNCVVAFTFTYGDTSLRATNKDLAGRLFLPRDCNFARECKEDYSLEVDFTSLAEAAQYFADPFPTQMPPQNLKDLNRRFSKAFGDLGIANYGDDPDENDETDLVIDVEDNEVLSTQQQVALIQKTSSVCKTEHMTYVRFHDFVQLYMFLWQQHHNLPIDKEKADMLFAAKKAADIRYFTQKRDDISRGIVSLKEQLQQLQRQEDALNEVVEALQQLPPESVG